MWQHQQPSGWHVAHPCSLTSPLRLQAAVACLMPTRLTHTACSMLYHGQSPPPWDAACQRGHCRLPIDVSDLKGSMLARRCLTRLHAASILSGP